MKHVFTILCFTCIVKLGVVSSEDRKDAPGVSDQRVSAHQAKAEDLEGSETAAKLFNLGSLFPTYSSNPAYRPGGYPTVGGGYYPSSTGGSYYPTYNPTQGYPTSGYYPTGTNVLGTGYGGYPTQTYYPVSGYSQTGANTYGYNTRTSGYGGYTGYGGYGGYGGNGGLRSYYGYNNPQYGGKRNLGFGYYADTDRYGFYRSPSQQLSVNRGYD